MVERKKPVLSKRKVNDEVYLLLSQIVCDGQVRRHTVATTTVATLAVATGNGGRVLSLVAVVTVPVGRGPLDRLEFNPMFTVEVSGAVGGKEVKSQSL